MSCCSNNKEGWKPENNSGCCSSGSNDCNSPTRATEGTPRYEWEKENGKLITIMYEERVDIGLGTTAFTIKYKRDVCEKSDVEIKKKCCTIRYKVIR